MALSDFDLVFFGGSGDLAMRKLLPAMYARDVCNDLPATARIICVGRDEMSQEAFIEMVETNAKSHVKENVDAAAWQTFLDRITYVAVDAGNVATYAALAEALRKDASLTRVYYLATPPQLFATICENLAAVGLATPNSRVVLEKPLGRDLASQIPGAKYLEYPDGDHAFWTGDVETTLGDIEEFVTGHREAPQDEFERVLATVLFTDIVDSTRRAVASGDHSWRKLLDRHDELAKEAVEKHRGVLVKTTGDGILATFDGPGRAVRCALTFGAASRQIGLPVRAGLHTGEIEIRGNDIGGIAVHAAARVMAQSDASEVLVSRVITDLVAGAGLKFAERGTYELKGLPGRWDLFAASV